MPPSGALELYVILIGDEIGGDKHPPLRQDRAQAAFRKRRLLLPWPKVIVLLAGHVNPNERQLLRFAARERRLFDAKRRNG